MRMCLYVCITIYIFVYKPAYVYYYNVYVVLQNRNVLKEKKMFWACQGYSYGHIKVRAIEGKAFTLFSEQ